jgi:hypothetical protein
VECRWLRGKPVVALTNLKPHNIETEPYVLLLEQNHGQELWVCYKVSGWKVYLRGKGPGELGWEAALEDGMLGGATQHTQHRSSTQNGQPGSWGDAAWTRFAQIWPCPGQPQTVRYAEKLKTLLPPDPAELLPTGNVEELSLGSPPPKPPVPLPNSVVNFLKHRHLVAPPGP